MNAWNSFLFETCFISIIIQDERLRDSANQNSAEKSQTNDQSRGKAAEVTEPHTSFPSHVINTNKRQAPPPPSSFAPENGGNKNSKCWPIVIAKSLYFTRQRVL